MTNLNPSSTSMLPEANLVIRHCFRAMNTAIEVTLSDWRAAHRLPHIEAVFHRFEARFSRFLPDSELSRFNARSTAAVNVSPEMWALLAECQTFYEITDGVFNPLVLDALTAAGYGASFERVGPADALRAVKIPSFGQLASRGTAVEMPVGLRIDFGGIGKGYSVDCAVESLHDCDGFLISAGGDIYAAGLAPDGQAWRIAVADPQQPDVALTTLALSDQAVATSWTTKRRWQAGSGWANHLIDPRTGLPVNNGVAGATVVARTTTEADVFAKTALILGPDEGCAFLEAQQVAGLLVL